jgi:hypothetical protein
MLATGTDLGYSAASLWLGDDTDSSFQVSATNIPIARTLGLSSRAHTSVAVSDNLGHVSILAITGECIYPSTVSADPGVGVTGLIGKGIGYGTALGLGASCAFTGAAAAEVAVLPTTSIAASIAADRNSALSSEIVAYRKLRNGWEGVGSVGPRPSAIRDALTFIDKIPFGAKTPDTTVAADGEVGFYWRTDHGYIDIGFKGDGTISYFARANGRMAKGIEPYGQDYLLPRDLSLVISSI